MEKTTTIGMDLGDRKHHISVLDSTGEVVEASWVENTREGLQGFFEARDPALVVMEVGTHSPWISRAVEQWGHEVLVANAHRVRAIWDSPIKHDKRDSELLARMGRYDRNLLHPIKHRGASAQTDLAVIKARDLAVRSRSQLIAHARGTVKSFGQRLPACSPACFPARALEALPVELYAALKGVLELIERINEQVKIYDAHIKCLCEQHYPETNRLRQIKGVGPITALAYVLTLEEPGRFKKSRQVGPYLGLTRKIDQSSECDKALPISKAGDKYLRRLLVESAHYIMGRRGPPCRLREHGERIAAGGGKSAKRRAVVAVARKLAVLLHRLWKTGAVYDPMYKPGAPTPLPTATDHPEPGKAPTPAAMDNGSARALSPA